MYNISMTFKINIPIQQVLYYLGYKDQKLDSHLLDDINSCIQIVLENMDIKYTYKLFDLKKDALQIPGKTIQELMDQSTFLFVFAVTLGHKVDRIVYQNQIKDVSKALLLDACCNAAIEQVCDLIESQLIDYYQKDHLFVSDRFSPGYGDFPLNYQSTLCQILDTSRKIGLHISDHLILNPKKSVTAVCAISDKPFTHRLKGCENCNLFFNCSLRKRGMNYGN